MINFRYHLVSLMAVFLSLALGIALGSTVVKEGVLENLDARIKIVSADAADRAAKNKELTAELARREAYERETAPMVVAGRLTDSKTVVLALRGMDATTVTNVTTLYQEAGSEAPSVIWLEPKWALATEADRADLRAVLGTQVDDTLLLSAGLTFLAERLASPRPPTTAATDDLQRLVDAGFLAIQAVGPDGRSELLGFPGGAGQVAALVARGTPIDQGAYTETFVGTLSDAMTAASLPTVIGERDTDREQFPDRGTAMRRVVGSTEVSTVDSLDTVSGEVALVLASAALRNGSVGHYGYGPGASRPLPEQ